MNEEQQKLKLEILDLQKTAVAARKSRDEAVASASVAVQELDAIKHEIEATRQEGAKARIALDTTLQARREEIEAEKGAISRLLEEKATLKSAKATVEAAYATISEEKCALGVEIQELKSEKVSLESDVMKAKEELVVATEALASEAKRLNDLKAREDAVAKRESAVMEKFKRAGIPY